MDQPKLERMLRLMQLLSSPVAYPVGVLAEKLETSPRTIYRYIDTFKSAGYVVEKIRGDIYQLREMSSRYPSIDNLVYFSEEEAYLVNSMIDKLVPSNSLKANLQHKLASIYDSTTIADYPSKNSNSMKLKELSDAVMLRRKVVLHDYESGNSGKISDRQVEPFAFTADNVDVWAYDLGDGRNKTFKISRIGEVEISDAQWSFESEHKRQPTDVFRMSGKPVERIVLRLSTLAKNLLTEEYPLSERQIRKEGDKWILDTEISSTTGAGRFLMGLPGDVEIVRGESLRAYVQEMAKKLL